MEVTLQFKEEFTVNIHGCDRHVLDEISTRNCSEIRTYTTDSGREFVTIDFTIGDVTIKLFS